jgi:hypothetical protein
MLRQEKLYQFEVTLKKRGFYELCAGYTRGKTMSCGLQPLNLLNTMQPEAPASRREPAGAKEQGIRHWCRTARQPA